MKLLLIILCLFNLVFGQDLLKNNENQYNKCLVESSKTQYFENTAQKCSNVFIIGGQLISYKKQKNNYNISNDVLLWNNTLNGWQLAKDTLLGYPWALFGSILSNNLNKPVCFIDISQEKFLISDWHPVNNKYYLLLKNAIKIGQKYGEPNILWTEFDSYQYDSDMEKHYKVYLYNIINSFKEFNWFISEFSSYPYQVNIIKKDNNSIIQMLNNTYAGPHLCLSSSDYYNDYFYQNYKGVEIIAKKWYNSFNNKSKYYELDNGYDRVNTYSEICLGITRSVLIKLIVDVILLGVLYIYAFIINKILNIPVNTALLICIILSVSLCPILSIIYSLLKIPFTIVLIISIFLASNY